jgi:hypothetical protein
MNLDQNNERIYLIYEGPVTGDFVDKFKKVYVVDGQFRAGFIESDQWPNASKQPYYKSLEQIVAELESKFWETGRYSPAFNDATRNQLERAQKALLAAGATMSPVSEEQRRNWRHSLLPPVSNYQTPKEPLLSIREDFPKPGKPSLSEPQS